MDIVSDHSSPAASTTPAVEPYTYPRTSNATAVGRRLRRDNKTCRTSFSPSTISPVGSSRDNSPGLEHKILGKLQTTLLPPSQTNNSPEKDDALELEKLQLLEMLKKLDEEGENKHIDDSPMVIGSDDEDSCNSPQLMLLTSESEETSPMRLTKDSAYLPSMAAMKAKQKLSFQADRILESMEGSMLKINAKVVYIYIIYVDYLC